MLSSPQPLPCGTRAPCRRCFFCLITQCASRSRRFLAVHLQESKSPRTQTPGAARDTKIQKWASLPVHDILARLDRPLTSRLNHVTKISCSWRRQGFRTCKCHVAGNKTLRYPAPSQESGVVIPANDDPGLRGFGRCRHHAIHCHIAGIVFHACPRRPFNVWRFRNNGF